MRASVEDEAVFARTHGRKGNVDKLSRTAVLQRTPQQASYGQRQLPSSPVAHGQFAVLDVFKTKVKFSELPQLVLYRYQAAMQQYGCAPLLVVEDANAGTQLLQIVESQMPELPRVAAKPVRAKILRAEGVTPITRGGLVTLPREVEWKDAFVSEMANFPVGQHDDVVDAFCHGLKAFISPADFRPMEFRLVAASDEHAQLVDELWERQQFLNETGMGEWDAAGPLDLLQDRNDW